MKYLLLALLFALLLVGCQNNNNDDDDNNSNEIYTHFHEYKDGVLYNIYEYDINHKLLNIYGLDTSNNYILKESYLYNNNDEIAYALDYFGDTMHFTYDNGKLKERNYQAVKMTAEYNSSGQVSGISINQFNCHYQFNYDGGDNIITILYDIPAGDIRDTFEFDAKTNPFYGFWPHKMTHPLCLNKNNITYHKQVRTENTNYHDPTLPPHWQTTTSTYHYEYQYNSNGMPIKKTEICITNPDTIVWTYDLIMTGNTISLNQKK